MVKDEARRAPSHKGFYRLIFFMGKKYRAHRQDEGFMAWKIHPEGGLGKMLNV